MASPQPIPGLEFQPERPDPASARDPEGKKPPEMRADTATERFWRRLRDIPRGLQSGLAGAASGLDTTAANALMLARLFPEFVTGAKLDAGPSSAEDYLRRRSAGLAKSSQDLSRGADAGAIEKASQVLGGLPIAVPEAIAAVETGGVVPGLTGLAALGAADQGPAAAARAAGEALPMALIFQGLHAVPPAVRAPVVGGATALLSQEQDPVKRATEALAMGATAGISPRALRGELQISVEGLPGETPPPPAAPAAEVSPLVSRARAKLGLPEQPGAHAAPVRIEGRPEPLASQYELVEADSVQASHNAVTFEPNHKYGAQQERAYNRDKNEQAKVIQGADRFNPQEVLNDAPNAVTGPPIVDAQGNAWAGNGRKMMMDRVYAGQAKTAPDVLKSAVVDAAPKFGLDPARAAEMQKPIIVRRLAPDEVPKTKAAGLDLSRQLNVDVTNAAAETARAQSQAAALDKGLTAFAEVVQSAGEDLTVRAALRFGPAAKLFAEALQADGIIPPTDRARWLEPTGVFTKHGVDQVEQMLLARVLPDEQLVRAAPADLRNKVLRSIPSILQVERAAPGSLAPLVADVVRSEIARANVAGDTPSVDEFNAQLSLGTAEPAPSQRDPRVAALQKLIAEGKPTAVSKRLGALRSRIQDVVGGQPELMTGRVPTLEEAFAQVLGVPAQGSSASESLSPNREVRTSAEGIDASAKLSPGDSTRFQLRSDESQASTKPGASGEVPRNLYKSPLPAQRRSSARIGSIEPVSNKKIVHEKETVEAVAEALKSVAPVLSGILDRVAAGVEGAVVEGPRFKKLEKIRTKLAQTDGRTPNTISDFMGGRITYRQRGEEIDLEAAFMTEAKAQGWEIIDREVHNDIWRATHLQVLDPAAGVSFEVQLTPEKINAVGHDHHDLYNRVKAGKASATERAELRRYFDEAWQATSARAQAATAPRPATPAGGGAGAPPEQPRAPPPGGAAPPPPPPPVPPEPGRAAPPPRRRPPTSSAEFYQRLAEKRGTELLRARGLANEAAKDAEAPFKQAAGTPLDRPASLREEEVSALLEELLARKHSTPKAVVDELLSRNDFDTLEHADVLLPSIARFYAAHAEVARRGVVKDEVLKELAEQQGLTEKQMLRRMVGETPNGETLLAMKDVVQRKLDRVNDLLEALDDPTKASPQKELKLATEHKILGLLWAQFRGATAEVGRALRATQLVASRQRARGGRLTLEDLKDIYETSHGGADNVNLLLEKLQKLRHTPEQLRTYLRKTYTATRWDQFMYAYRAVILSGLRTLARNFLGNFALMIQAPVEKEVGAVAGRMLELLPARRIRIPIPGTGKNLVNIAIRERAEGVDRSRLGEGFADAIGIISAGRAAARLYWDTVFGPAPEGAGVVRSAMSLPGRFLFNEEISAEALASQRTSTPIPGRIGTALGVVYRQLEAWDVAFRHPNRVGELTAIAWRDAGKRGLRKPAEILEHMREFTLDPPEWAWKTADKYAKELTLVAPLGAKGRAWSNFVNKVPPLQFLQPFTRVPTNMWTEIGKRGPIAMMMGDVRTALERGGAERDRALGQILVGSALLTYAAVLSRQGFLNGAGPADPKLRRIKMETGWRPYHVKIGDTYYGIRGAEPISTQLGIVADLVEAHEHLRSEEAGSIFSQLGISAVRNMADQSMMAGLAGVLEAVSLQDPKALDRFFSRSVAGVLVPRGLEGPISAVKAAGGAISGEPDERPWRADPFLRETRGLVDDVLVRAGMSEAYLKELGRDRLSPRTGFWAQPLEKPNIVGPDWVSPFTSSKANDDPVTAELYRLVLARKDGLPGLPAYDDVPDSIGEVKLTPRQAWEYKSKARGNAKLELDKIVNGDRWAALDKIPDAGVRDTIKAQIFDAVITGWQDVARAEMMGTFSVADRMKAVMDDKTNRLLRAQGRMP